MSPSPLEVLTDLLDTNSLLSHHEHPEVGIIWNYWPFNWLVPQVIAIPLNILFSPLVAMFGWTAPLWNFLPDSVLYVFINAILWIFGITFSVLLLALILIIGLSPYIVIAGIVLFWYQVIVEIMIAAGDLDSSYSIFYDPYDYYYYNDYDSCVYWSYTYGYCQDTELYYATDAVIEEPAYYDNSTYYNYSTPANYSSGYNNTSSNNYSNSTYNQTYNAGNSTNNGT